MSFFQRVFTQNILHYQKNINILKKRSDVPKLGHLIVAIFSENLYNYGISCHIYYDIITSRYNRMKKRVQLHAKDVMCYQENEEYYLNRFPKKAKTEGMVYYFQKIDGVIIKTEITVEQWKELYLFNKRLYIHF